MPSLTIHGATITPTSTAFVHPLPMEHPNWQSVADLAWLEARIAAVEVEDCERAIVQLEQRLVAAEAWFSSREPSHPHWQAALQRQAAIEREQRGMEAVLPLRYRRCWVGCIDLHVALRYGMTELEAAAWLQTHQDAPGGAKRSPASVWTCVAGERSQPGSWPTEERDYWIVHRPRRVELWHLPEMRELLRRRAS